MTRKKGILIGATCVCVISFLVFILCMLGARKNSTKDSTTVEASTTEATSEQTSEETAEFKSKAQKLYATTTLIALEKPEAGAEVLASITVGATVEITGVRSDGWYRICLKEDSKNVEAYVQAKEGDLVAQVLETDTYIETASSSNVNNETTTEAKKKSSKTEESTEKTSKKKGKAVFTQDESDYGTEEVTPKEPEVDVFDVNNQ